MAISCRWRTDTLWSLKPCHCNRIKRMKISEDFSFSSTTTKDNDFWSCKNSRMSISWGWGRSWYFRFCKFISIYIEYVSIIEICISFGFASEIMTSKYNDWSSRQSSRVSSSWARAYTLDDGISPLPSSDLKLSIRVLTWRLLRIWALTFFAAFMTLRMTFLLTVLWMLRLFHFLHIRTFLLLLLIFIRPISLIWSIFFWKVGLIITLHWEIRKLKEVCLNYKFGFK